MDIYLRIARRIADSLYKIIKSQGDGWKITSPHGEIEYRIIEDEDGETINEIWWVESSKPGHGTELVNYMLKEHPANAIAWGVTSHSGEKLMEKFHRLYPKIQCIKGVHEGQFNPFEHLESHYEQDDY